MNPKYARCRRHGGYPESLQPGKRYKVVADREAAAAGMIRIIDESGEDYLYPQSYFAQDRSTRAKPKHSQSQRTR